MNLDELSNLLGLFQANHLYNNHVVRLLAVGTSSGHMLLEVDGWFTAAEQAIH